MADTYLPQKIRVTTIFIQASKQNMEGTPHNSQDVNQIALFDGELK